MLTVVRSSQATGGLWYDRGTFPPDPSDQDRRFLFLQPYSHRGVEWCRTALVGLASGCDDYM